MHCPVCLESLAGSGVVASTPCGHIFHENCLAAVPESHWSKGSRRCPTCRASYMCRFETKNMLNPGPLRRVYVSFAEPPIAPDDAQKEIMLLRAELQQTRELLQQQVQEAHELKQKLSQTQDKLRDLKVNQDEAAAALAGQLTDAREQLRKAEKREQNAMQRTKAIGEALLEERASGQELRDQAQKLQRKVERLNEGTETVAETLTRQPALSASAGIRRKLVTQKAKVQLTARRKSFASPALSRGRRVGRSDIVAFEPSGFIFDLWVARRANGPEMRILVRRD